MEQARIHLLSEQVTNKIAAGEVVERPASVLKELLENSLDAGADRIDVEIVEGGRRVLAVTDNGAGMGSDDALMAIQRYATSKIADVEDIENIQTMGFRGEALAAISSVSRFRLVTRTPESTEGAEVTVAGGKVQSVETIGALKGTRVEVRNMFFNVPARRKFMRTAKTEFSHIRQKFLVYALSHPEVGMTLKSDERTIYSLPGDDSLEHRLREIYGDSLGEALRRVDCSQDNVRVRGYVALPRVSRSDRSDQYVFVNNRPAAAPVLGYAIREGYHTLMPAGKHAVLFLFIETPPALVDVNVHPTKREVRFRNSNNVRDAIIQGIRTALETRGNRDSQPSGAISAPDESREVPREEQIKIEDIPRAPSFRYPRISMLGGGANFDKDHTSGVETENGRLEKGSDGEHDFNTPWSECRVLGQIGGLFVILETEDGMVVMDPHAAHERVMYERLMGQVKRNKVQSQGLLKPETLDMSPENATIIRKHENVLQDMGFGISSFGGDSFIVDAIPSCLGEFPVEEMVENLAKSAERGGASASVEHGAQERVAMAACKAAVKAGDILTLSEIERLVIDLAQSQMPYTCPHGRPTMTFTSFKELQKKFGRIK